MLIFIVLIVIVLIVVALVAIKGGLSVATKQENELSFVARPDLFSAADRSFYGVLDQALGGEYRIFGKVRLGDLVEPAKGLTKSQSTTARNRLNQKHVDFVLCRYDTLAVVAVIELDDASHGRKDRSDRDDFVDKPLLPASAGGAYSGAKGVRATRGADCAVYGVEDGICCHQVSCTKG